MYTHQAGSAQALQQNWQSSEKSSNFKENTQYLMNTLYDRSLSGCCSPEHLFVLCKFTNAFLLPLSICRKVLYANLNVCLFVLCAKLLSNAANMPCVLCVNLCLNRFLTSEERVSVFVVLYFVSVCVNG